MKHKGTLIITLGLLLIVAALCLTGYNYWDDYRAAKEANQVLNNLIPQVTGTGEQPQITETDEDGIPAQTIDGEKYIGVISIPELDLELPVMKEWSYKKLRSAPCRFTGSVKTNDLVICAHNYSKHFGKLKNLSFGDELIFADVDGRVYTYRVTEVETVDPTDVEGMTVGYDWDITLFTCNMSGRARVAVRGERTS